MAGVGKAVAGMGHAHVAQAEAAPERALHRIAVAGRDEIEIGVPGRRLALRRRLRRQQQQDGCQGGHRDHRVTTSPPGPRIGRRRGIRGLFSRHHSELTNWINMDGKHRTKAAGRYIDFSKANLRFRSVSPADSRYVSGNTVRWSTGRSGDRVRAKARCASHGSDISRGHHSGRGCRCAHSWHHSSTSPSE